MFLMHLGGAFATIIAYMIATSHSLFRTLLSLIAIYMLILPICILTGADYIGLIVVSVYGGGLTVLFLFAIIFASAQESLHYWQLNSVVVKHSRFWNIVMFFIQVVFFYALVYASYRSDFNYELIDFTGYFNFINLELDAPLVVLAFLLFYEYLALFVILSTLFFISLLIVSLVSYLTQHKQTVNSSNLLRLNNFIFNVLSQATHYSQIDFNALFYIYIWSSLLLPLFSLMARPHHLLHSMMIVEFIFVWLVVLFTTITYSINIAAGHIIMVYLIALSVIDSVVFFSIYFIYSLLLNITNNV